MLLLLPLAGCIDYDVYLKGHDDPPVDDDPTPILDDSGLTDPPDPPTEACNGEDDDGDGAIDEDFPDDDGNGRADCLDVTCPPLTVGAAGTVDVDATCVGTPVATPTDPWSWRVKWAIDADASGVDNSITAPMVVPLFDDDGDGDIDADDGRYIVFSGLDLTGWTGAITVLDATGATVWTEIGAGFAGAIGVGDLDGDGSPEILGTTVDSRVKAWHPDDTAFWTSEPDLVFGGTASVVDLHGDGLPEVLVGDMVLDGLTGDVLFRLPGGPPDDWGHATPVDVDGDGEQEIYWRAGLYSADGDELWAATAPPGGFLPAVVQADTDPEPEFVAIGEEYRLYDTDGAALAAVPLSTGSTFLTGAPCVADLDGDGTQEVAFARGYVFYALELDGTEMWSETIHEEATSGCATFDFDGDGAFEVTYADEVALYVFDGATGEIRLTDEAHGSGTGSEFPVVADVDRDGHAELLDVSYGMWGDPDAPLLRVLEHDGDGWPGTSAPWATHDDPGTFLDASGRVPRAAAPYWLSEGVYRGRATDGTVSSPDLGVAITDVCVADCTYGPVAVAIQAWNAGGSDTPGAVTVDLYTLEGGVERLLVSEELPAISAGTSAAGLEIAVAPADVGDGGFVARVRGAWSAWECDPADDEDRWEDGGCP